MNFPDLLLCQGVYQLKLEPPFTPGMNLLGEVTELSRGVNNHAVGDTVTGAVRHDAFAEYALLDAISAFSLPRALSLARAAAYPSAYLTAYISVVQRAQLQADESVLVHGAVGGTGIAAVNLAKVIGATVIATLAKKKSLDF